MTPSPVNAARPAMMRLDFFLIVAASFALFAGGRDVKHLGLRVEISHEFEHVPAAYDPRDLAVRIVQIAEGPGVSGAPAHTGREEPLVNILDAERAFLDHPPGPHLGEHEPVVLGPVVERIAVAIFPVREPVLREARILKPFLETFPGLLPVELPHPVGTGGHTVPAADAALVIDEHDPVFPLPRGAHGTDLDAGGVVAVLAR